MISWQTRFFKETVFVFWFCQRTLGKSSSFVNSLHVICLEKSHSIHCISLIQPPHPLNSSFVTWEMSKSETRDLSSYADQLDWLSLSVGRLQTLTKVWGKESMEETSQFLEKEYSRIKEAQVLRGWSITSSVNRTELRGSIKCVT